MSLTISKVVSTLPNPLDADTIYLVRVDAGFDLYVTDNSGSVSYKLNADLEMGPKWGYVRDLTGSENLNNITAPGMYETPLSVDAASGVNYPVALAGMLYVEADNSHIYQTYRQYNNGGTYQRTNYQGSWYSWERVFADNYHPNADKLTTARNIALSGDVTGTTSFDGSGNVTITTTVVDDSHNHTIANVDGLQTALTGKLAVGAKAADSELLDGKNSTDFVLQTEKGTANGIATLDGSGLVPTNQLPSYVDDVLEYANFAAFPASGVSGKIYINQAEGDVYRWSGSAYIQISDAVSSADQATKLATARTIALSGDVSGSVSFNGTSNVTITATVADDSHNHIISNVDGLQAALDSKEGTISAQSRIGAEAKYASNANTALESGWYYGDGSSVNFANKYVTMLVLNRTNGGSSTVRQHQFYTNGEIWSRDSDDDGATWTAWTAADAGKLGGLLPTQFARVDQATTTFDGGLNTTINVVSDDGGESLLNLVGPGQGTGRLYVGQSYNHGGGIEYNGDGTPVSSGTTDKVSLFARNNGVNKEVAYWGYSGLDFIFPAGVAVKASESLTVVDVDAYADEGFTVSGNTPNVRLRQDDNGNSAVQLAHNGGMFYVLADADGNGNWESIPLEIQVDGLAENFKAYGHKVWHEGNHGAGSGLDADLLDGLDLRGVRNQVTVRDVRNVAEVPGSTGAEDYMPDPDDALHSQSVQAYFSQDYPSGGWAGILSVSGWNSSYVTWQLAGPSGGSNTADGLWYRAGDVDTWTTWQEIYHTGNDDNLAKIDAFGNLGSVSRSRSYGPNDSGTSTERYHLIEYPSIYMHTNQQVVNDWVIQLPGVNNNTFYNGKVRFKRNYEDTVEVCFHGYYKSTNVWNALNVVGGTSTDTDFARFIRFGKDGSGNPVISIANRDVATASVWSDYASVEIVEVSTGWTGAATSVVKDPANYKIISSTSDTPYTWQYTKDMKPAMATILRRRYIDVAEYVPVDDTLDCTDGINKAFSDGEGREVVFTNPYGSTRQYRITGSRRSMIMPRKARIIGNSGAKIVCDWNTTDTVFQEFWRVDGVRGTPLNAFPAMQGDDHVELQIPGDAVNFKVGQWAYISSADMFTIEESTYGTKGEWIMIRDIVGSEIFCVGAIQDTYTGDVKLAPENELVDLDLEGLNIQGPGALNTAVDGDIGIQIYGGGKLNIKGCDVTRFDKHNYFLNGRQISIEDSLAICDGPTGDRTQYPIAILNSVDRFRASNCVVQGGKEGICQTSSGSNQGITRDFTVDSCSISGQWRTAIAGHDNCMNFTVVNNRFRDCEQFLNVRSRGAIIANNHGTRSGAFSTNLDCAVQFENGVKDFKASGNVWEDVLRGYWLDDGTTGGDPRHHEEIPGNISIVDDRIDSDRATHGILLDFMGDAGTDSNYTDRDALLGRLNFKGLNYKLRNTGSALAVETAGRWDRPFIGYSEFYGGGGGTACVWMRGVKLVPGSTTYVSGTGPDRAVVKDVGFTGGYNPPLIQYGTGTHKVKYYGIDHTAAGESF